MAIDTHPDVEFCFRHPKVETMVHCSECERPICTDCMRPAAVGIRCPECGRPAVASGTRAAKARMRRARSLTVGGGTTATVVLIAVNVLVFLAEMAQGVTLSGTGGGLIDDGAVYAGAVADGEWWRMGSAGFLHAGLMHLGFNMFALWILGGPLEQYVGTLRMVLIYASAVLWGSVGALLLSPDSFTVGASGGVFGLMAALLVLSRQQGMEMMFSSVGGLLLINLGITFVLPGISIGGHLGGIVGGAAAAFALSGFGRGHMAYGRITAPIAVASVALLAGAVAVGVMVAQAAV